MVKRWLSERNVATQGAIGGLCFGLAFVIVIYVVGRFVSADTSYGIYEYSLFAFMGLLIISIVVLVIKNKK